MSPESQDVLRQIREVERDTSALVAGLTDAQFQWRALPATWSIGECLAHLNVTNQIYLSTLSDCIDRAQQDKLTGQGPFHYGWISRWFVRSMEPPAKFKVKAPKSVAPPQRPLRDVVREFHQVHEQVLRQVERSDGLHLAKAKFRSPFFRLLKMELGQGFQVICAHDRRHLWQAWQVRQNAAFPGASQGKGN